MILVEGLSKSYVISHQRAERYTALRDVLANKARGFFRSSGRPQTREEFFALRDVSFEVKQGDRMGIIGRNGAGKSTLLKILSRITEPTKGRITLNGRVASLLEVGTGFHPELTGRENIFLNGAILGMGKAEIARKFDEIVAFSEVEKFLDTPVKRYSSGMYVRLAFAVAAHLEPEILIVDEVLAVGDAAFQRKCLGKMEGVAAEGRTVLFVSHQMDAVQRLCNKGLLLNQGVLVTSGGMEHVIQHYLQNQAASSSRFPFTPPPHEDAPSVWAEGLQMEDDQGNAVAEIPIGRPWKARITFTVNKRTEGFVIALGVSTLFDLAIRTTWSQAATFEPGTYQAVFSSDDIHLTDGIYKLVVGLSVEGRTVQYVNDRATLTVSDVSELTGNTRIVNTKSGLIMDQMDVHVTRVA